MRKLEIVCAILVAVLAIIFVAGVIDRRAAQAHPDLQKDAPSAHASERGPAPDQR